MKKVDVAQVSAALRKSAELLGESNPKKENECGFTPGLGQIADAKNVLAKAVDAERGLFTFLVMGRFKTGKSTLINTILCENVLATKITPATGIIAQIENGKPGKVTVYYENDENGNPREPVEMDEKAFFDVFTLTAEDSIECDQTGRIERYKDVDSAVIRRNCELIKDGSRIVDSPGLDESISQQKTTERFLPKANAIIFVMSASNAFGVNEREYITQNFAGKSPKNVFFVFNFANNIKGLEQMQDLEKKVKKELEKVFCRKDGSFDEELFQNRIFYVDAFHSGQLRVEGEAYDLSWQSAAKIPRPDITLESTELPKLEAAIKNFLDSDEKAAAQFKTIISNAAGSYDRAKKAVDNAYQASQLPLAELKSNTEAAQKELNNAQMNLDNISLAFDSYQTILYTRLVECSHRLRNNIERDWPAFAAGAPDFTRVDMLQIAGNNILRAIPINNLRNWASDNLKEHFEKPNKYCEPFFKKHMDEFNNELNKTKDEVASEVSGVIGVQGALIAKSIDLAKYIQLNGTTQGQGKEFNGGDALKTLIHLVQFDFDAAVDAAAGGQSWRKAGASLLQHFGVELGMALIIPWTWAFIAADIAYQLVKLKQAGIELAAKMVGQVKQGYDEKLRDVLTEYVNNLPNIIQRSFSSAKREVVEPMQAFINETKSKMDKLLADRESATFDAEKQKENGEKNLAALRDSISTLNQALYGNPLTETEIIEAARYEIKAVDSVRY